jgi:hypothetical protein
MNTKSKLLLLKDIEKHYRYYGNEFLFDKTNYFIIFNNETQLLHTFVEDDERFTIREKKYDDYFVRVKHLHDIDETIGFEYKSKKFFDIPITNVKNKLSKVNKMLSADISFIFDLSKTLIETIKDTFKKYQGTHIQFLSVNRKLIMRIFNFRNFINQDFDFGYAEYIISNVEVPTDISFTLRQISFDKLMSSNYEVYVYENGLVKFELIENDIEIVFRSQNIVAPIIEFNHSSIDKNISLLLEPKTNQPLEHTNRNR